MSQSTRTRYLAGALSLGLVGGSAPAAAGPNPNESTRLIITVRGFRNDKGQAGISVFQSSEGFPSDYGKAAMRRVTSIQKGTVQWTIESIKPGRYAISVLHDENSNGKMDTNFLGIPTEGYGVSRDARRPFGPPLFEDAAITVKGAHQVVGIQVKY